MILLLKFVSKGPITTIPVVVRIMAWCLPGDKQWYEPDYRRIYVSLGLNELTLTETLVDSESNVSNDCRGILNIYNNWHFHFRHFSFSAFVEETCRCFSNLYLAAFRDKMKPGTGVHLWEIMMTSSNGNIFRVTDHLCGEFTSPRWIPHTKASDAELWCFLWSASE